MYALCNHHVQCMYMQVINSWCACTAEIMAAITNYIIDVTTCVNWKLEVKWRAGIAVRIKYY